MAVRLLIAGNPNRKKRVKRVRKHKRSVKRHVKRAKRHVKRHVKRHKRTVKTHRKEVRKMAKRKRHHRKHRAHKSNPRRHRRSHRSRKNPVTAIMRGKLWGGVDVKNIATTSLIGVAGFGIQSLLVMKVAPNIPTYTTADWKVQKLIDAGLGIGSTVLLGVALPMIGIKGEKATKMVMAFGVGTLVNVLASTGSKLIANSPSLQKALGLTTATATSTTGTGTTALVDRQIRSDAYAGVRANPFKRTGSPI